MNAFNCTTGRLVQCFEFVGKHRGINSQQYQYSRLEYTSRFFGCLLRYHWERSETTNAVCVHRHKHKLLCSKPVS